MPPNWNQADFRIINRVTCSISPERPTATYGPTFSVFPIEKSSRIQPRRTGLLAGGMTVGGVLSEDVWTWELQDLSEKVSTSVTYLIFISPYQTFVMTMHSVYNVAFDILLDSELSLY